MRKPQGSAHLRTVFDQPYVSAAQPYVTTCLLAVGLTPVYKVSKAVTESPIQLFLHDLVYLNILKCVCPEIPKWCPPWSVRVLSIYEVTVIVLPIA